MQSRVNQIESAGQKELCLALRESATRNDAHARELAPGAVSVDHLA